jgi:hypothetical protein
MAWGPVFSHSFKRNDHGSGVQIARFAKLIIIFANNLIFFGILGSWRNHVRLKIWSEVAEEIMQRKGIRVIDSNGITLPWTPYTLDGSHFHTLPAMDALTDEILHKLNICGV